MNQFNFTSANAQIAGQKGVANGLASLDSNGLVPNSQLPGATQSAAGTMSAADKTKLDGIATGATANVVSDSLSDTSTTNALSAAKGKALNQAIGNLNAENEYDGASAASLTAAIEAAIDALSNDSKMHVITVTKGAKVILLVQKYSSGSYASYVGYCYALTNPINGEKVNGTWTHSTLALKSDIPDVNVQTGGLSTNVATTFNLTKGFGYIIIKLPQTATSATGYMYFFAKHNGYANVYAISGSTGITITTSGGSISITTSHQHGGTVGIIEYGS